MTCGVAPTDHPCVFTIRAPSGRFGPAWYVETPREAPGRIEPQDCEALARNIALAEGLGATIVRVKADRLMG
jgi:hypothetical protein